VAGVDAFIPQKNKDTAGNVGKKETNVDISAFENLHLF